MKIPKFVKPFAILLFSSIPFYGREWCLEKQIWQGPMICYTTTLASIYPRFSGMQCLFKLCARLSQHAIWHKKIILNYCAQKNLFFQLGLRARAKHTLLWQWLFPCCKSTGSNALFLHGQLSKQVKGLVFCLEIWQRKSIHTFALFTMLCMIWLHRQRLPQCLNRELLK